jgi:hypothetical protein
VTDLASPAPPGSLTPARPATPGLEACTRRHPGLVLDLEQTIGWHSRPHTKGGPEFLIVRRRRHRAPKVLQTYPLTDAGWREAWEWLAAHDPPAAEKVRADLAAHPAMVPPGPAVPRPRSVDAPGTPSVEAGADEPTYDARAQALRKNLQHELNREFSVPQEKRKTKVRRAVSNPYLVLGAATVGVGVAGVLTAGTVHLVLGAVGASQLSATGAKGVECWKSRAQGTVYLELDAVEYLVAKPTPQMRVKAVEEALSGRPRGDTHISRHDLIQVEPRPGARERLGRVVRALHSSYGRAGLALLSAGLFLIAVTVIPEYIQSFSLRAAAVVSAIGAILIATAMAEEFTAQ